MPAEPPWSYVAGMQTKQETRRVGRLEIWVEVVMLGMLAALGVSYFFYAISP